MWPELPRNMMISVTVLPRDRGGKANAICYLAIRVRKGGHSDRMYKEFGGVNPETYLEKIALGVDWLERVQGRTVPKFKPPSWRTVLKRLNLKQEIQTIKRYQFTDQREPWEPA